ncbi:MAG: hybrid sensor histidine kinase/response regulator, partial [Leptolyngbyaceae bacterium]|nr:hybrid sensor histidine kinase/response regulator [Leptolyngbyaceae bacterium]
DLILMDIMLRGKMDGIEAAHHIYTTHQIPIVYLTANADEDSLQRAKSTHPFGYILKPFKSTELQVTIEISLARHQTELEVRKALAIAETLRQEAQELSHLKSDFTSMVSHELRNSLAVIKSSAAMLRTYDARLTEEKKQQHIQRIQSAAESMNQLLEDILTLGRAEANQLECTPTSIDVLSFCQELLETLQWSVNGEQYTLKLTSQGNNDPIADLDERLLWHVLNNLLHNAIKYSPQGGTITLTLDCREKEICFQVQDQGIGIPLSDQKNLFEPFQRASNVGQILGTGLGLAIVKRSVELHKGKIEVQSEVGQGTTFLVTLPRKQE